MRLTSTVCLTGRKRIPRNRIRFDLSENSEGIRHFDAKVDFSGLDLPDSGRVFITPYFKHSSMRFDYGTVESFGPSGETLLTDLDSSSTVLFRLHVVEEEDGLARILASADRIPATMPDDDAKESDQAIISLAVRDLGDEVWKLELEGEKPRLVINSRIPDARTCMESDPIFHGLVLPSVIRQIMSHIFINRLEGEKEEEGTWESHWIRFAEDLADEDIPEGDDPEGKEKWVEQAILSFSTKFGLGPKTAAAVGRHLGEG